MRCALIKVSSNLVSARELMSRSGIGLAPQCATLSGCIEARLAKRLLTVSFRFFIGAGAGQAMEDGYILGRALHDYFKSLDTKQGHSLADAMQLYQSVRHPRAVKVQTTSRQAGDVYELRAAEVAGLSYDESLPVAKSMLEHRMKWIWGDDIDDAYEKARDQSFQIHSPRIDSDPVQVISCG